jgi:hypothetical protein
MKDRQNHQHKNTTGFSTISVFDDIDLVLKITTRFKSSHGYKINYNQEI